MNEFDYDVKQKKSIARGAYARKGGSKSKRCSLPSDLLTEAQKRKLNGPCDSVKLDEPMTWERFKSLPLSLAKEYISNLHETYGANQKMLAQMFGVSRPVICKKFAAMGIAFEPGRRESAAEVAVRQAKWDAFCHGVVGGGSLVTPDPIESVEPIAVEPIAEDRCKTEHKPVPARATSLCATFDGFPDLATLESFYRLVGTDKVKVTINIEVVG